MKSRMLTEILKVSVWMVHMYWFWSNTVADSNKLVLTLSICIQMGRNESLVGIKWALSIFLHDDDWWHIWCISSMPVYNTWDFGALTELAVVYEDGNLISATAFSTWVSETIIMSYTVALLLLFRLWTVRPHHVEATHRPLQLISAHFEFAWPWACVLSCVPCVRARITLCIISRRALIHRSRSYSLHAHGSRKLLIRSELKFASCTRSLRNHYACMSMSAPK